MNENLRSYGERIRREGGNREAAQGVADWLAENGVDAVEFVALCGGDLLWHWYSQVYDKYENYEYKHVSEPATVELRHADAMRGPPPRSPSMAEATNRPTPIPALSPPLLSAGMHATLRASPTIGQRALPAVVRPTAFIGGIYARVLAAPAVVDGKMRKPYGLWLAADWALNSRYLRHMRDGYDKRLLFNDWVQTLYRNGETLTDILKRMEQNEIQKVPKLLRGLEDTARLPVEAIGRQTPKASPPPRRRASKKRRKAA